MSGKIPAPEFSDICLLGHLQEPSCKMRDGEEDTLGERMAIWRPVSQWDQLEWVGVRKVRLLI